MTFLFISISLLTLHSDLCLAQHYDDLSLLVLQDSKAQLCWVKISRLCLIERLCEYSKIQLGEEIVPWKSSIMQHFHLHDRPLVHCA